MEKLTLTKEQWEAAQKRIEMVSDAVAQYLRGENVNGKGNEHADEFITDMQIALTAMGYVANFAADKCVFIGVSDNER